MLASTMQRDTPSRILTSSCGSIEGPTLIPLFCQLCADSSGKQSSHGIRDTPKVLDMSTIKLPSPISYPDEM